MEGVGYILNKYETIKNELISSNIDRSNLMFVSQNIKENNVNIQINKQILENKKLNKRL